MLIAENLNKMSYIQQKDGFDYLKNLMKSLDKRTCLGILLYSPSGTGKTLLGITFANAFKYMT